MLLPFLAHIDDPKPPAELPCTVYTYVRPLVKFPAGFEAKTRENKTRIMPMKNERMLLNQLLGNVCSLALQAFYDDLKFQ